MPFPIQPAPVRPIRVAQDSHVLQTLADTLKHAGKIVVITGAGISTGAGIKDFRSPGGLYAGGELFYESVFVDLRKTKLLQTALQLRELAANCEPIETYR
ncbi:hypothetical protein BR93DRAFT_974675 [Coniochaeta sp. PMI_546]|nr:hypothetical protein BR93DRAFT_974675 [Coniochaeta sp. PMI_546]